MPTTFESKTFKAAAGSDSLKTTVPQAVATVLGLDPGDVLVWTVDVGSRTAVVVRSSKSDREGVPTGSAAPKKSSKRS